MSISKLSFNLITSLSEWGRLEPEWNALLQRSAANHVFLTWEYVSTWLEVYGTDWQLCVLTARDENGVLRGIAPFAIGPGYGKGRRWLRHLTLLGGECESTAEYGDFIIERGFEAALGARFCEAILTERSLKWDVLRFGYTRADSLAMQTAQAVLRNKCDAPAQFREHRAWLAPLEESWERFEKAHLSAQRRNLLRRRWKKLTANHSVRVLVAGRDISVSDALERVIDLNRDRWAEGGGLSFHTEKYLAFHRRFAPRVAERGWLALLILEADGQPVSARYDFVYGGVLNIFQGGWRRDFADASLGQIMTEQAIRHAIGLGLHTVDFMAGDSASKASWTRETRLLADVEACNPRSLRGRFAWLLRQAAFSRTRGPAAQTPAPATEAFA